MATKQSTAAPATGQRFAGAPGATPPPKKSGGILKIILIVAVAIISAAGGFFGVRLAMNHVAAVKAAKGNPAAMVPVATAAASSQALDLMAKVHDAYTNLHSVAISGTSVAVIDMSQVTAADVNPNAKNNAAATRRAANIPKGITNSMDVTIKLSRPDLYLIEGVGRSELGRMKMTNTIAIWSPGQTNYSLMLVGGAGNQGFKRYTTVKDRNQAFMMTGQSGGLAMAIPQLFFNEESQMAQFITDWQQTADESLDGQDCYTVLAKMMGQKLKIWISKSSYMILKSEITLGAPVSDADIQAAISTFDTRTNKTPQEIQQEQTMAKQQAAMMTKIRGTVTETYDNVQLNPTLTADDFNYPVPRGTRLVPGQ